MCVLLRHRFNLHRCCSVSVARQRILIYLVWLSPRKKQVPSEPSHSTDLSHLHTLVAEQVQNALEHVVRERNAHIQHLNSMLQQQTAFRAQSCGKSVPQPDLHREMLARVKEFDGDDDKWLGWWFKLQFFFLKANHLGYEGVIRENRARD